MTIIPPVAAVNVGASTGGGIIDTIKSAVGLGSSSAAGGTTPTQSPKGDGSVGLFDGVGMKALIGGAAGAAIGFLPFIPGGPILGGIVGALGGAALGVFTNWRKMAAIKEHNQATIAAMGVQTNDPNVQQILQSGDVSQLAAYAQAQQGGGTSTETTTTTAPQATVAPTTVQAGSRAIDPSTGADPGLVPTAGGGGSVGETRALIAKLQAQIDTIKAYLDAEQKSDAEHAVKHAQLDATAATAAADSHADVAAARHNVALAAA